MCSGGGEGFIATSHGTMYLAKDESTAAHSGIESNTASSSGSNALKRKADTSTQSVTAGRVAVDLTASTPSPKKQKKAQPPEEKRLKRYRPHAPLAYQEVRDRALTQRMFVLDRRRDTSQADHPIESISLAGTTGNVYTIVVNKIPTCDCPHARKGNQCKHIVYVLSRVLRVPAHLEYQLAFLSSELKEIFDKAPPLPSQQAEETQKDGKRKLIDGECPICCVDFDPEDAGEEVVYCKAGCGNNVHAECFRRWAATKKGQEVTCPFCRTVWQGDEDALKQVANSGQMTEEGYVNVAGQLGITGKRDYSSYHAPWVRRQFGYDY